MHILVIKLNLLPALRWQNATTPICLRVLLCRTTPVQQVLRTMGRSLPRHALQALLSISVFVKFWYNIDSVPCNIASKAKLAQTSISLLNVINSQSPYKAQNAAPSGHYRQVTN